ncbi:Kelch repeat-containing protein [Streptomyces antimicrobicus]|uniref:Kelch-like protein 17 n=1 Tax=Streptomyces antimicrobicus TaxID=2883108 RepID=A0ABS8B035_9ACTN|nr:kelch repeat-containing protein [Streptomyces antimicrobicus]MCB5177965.1 Kelch-like protein 17 [Streptomyces antimicrobicus]
MSSPPAAAAGGWTKTGDLPLAASWYGQHDGAVLLKNGQVLVVGGADAQGRALAKGAVYDPATGAWTATTSLRDPRRLHTVTRLGNGKVLVTGGTSGPSRLSPPLNTVELYEPGTDTWKTVTAMREARCGHTAVPLDGTLVLVAGGYAARSATSVRALRTAEVYDWEADTWHDAKPMNDARADHGAVRFKAGRVLVSGGTVPVSPTGDTALAFCELYDPATDTWTPTGSLLQPRGGHRSVLASDTTALVVGGATPGTAGDGTYAPFRTLTAERYDVTTGEWAALPEAPGGRGAHQVVPLGTGSFLVAGGTADVHNGAGYQSTLILDPAAPAARTWTAAAGQLTGRWAFAAVALDRNKVLVTGGTVQNGLAAPDPATAELTRSTEIFTAGSPG